MYYVRKTSLHACSTCLVIVKSYFLDYLFLLNSYFNTHSLSMGHLAKLTGYETKYLRYKVRRKYQYEYTIYYFYISKFSKIICSVLPLISVYCKFCVLWFQILKIK